LRLNVIEIYFIFYFTFYPCANWRETAHFSALSLFSHSAPITNPEITDDLRANGSLLELDSCEEKEVENHELA
jgi:hypothetical protein